MPSTPLMNPVGRHKETGQLHTPTDDIPHGKKCGCVCVDCGQPLVLKRSELGRLFFAHQGQSSQQDQGAGCGEGYYHKLCVAILGKEFVVGEKFLVPAGYSMRNRIKKRPQIEKHIAPNYRPDAIIQLEHGQRLLVEVCDTNKKSWEDREKIAEVVKDSDIVLEVKIGRSAIHRITGEHNGVTKKAQQEIFELLAEEWNREAIYIGPKSPISAFVRRMKKKRENQRRREEEERARIQEEESDNAYDPFLRANPHLASLSRSQIEQLKLDQADWDANRAQEQLKESEEEEPLSLTEAPPQPVQVQTPYPPTSTSVFDLPDDDPRRPGVGFSPVWIPPHEETSHV